MKTVVFFSFILFSISHNLFSQDQSYSFFIAGHVYGTPGVQNVGFHPPFKAKFEYIQEREEIEFGVFLGDLVIYGSEEKWENVIAEFDTLGLLWYIAVGNHDLKNPEYYYAQFGDITYYSFSHNNDLFIILNPNIDSWNISGDQLVFLQNTLNEDASNHDNIFVMMHQLLWWSPDNEYSVITLNSLEGRASEINFWSEIEPLFHELDNNVVMCAGDLGAASYATSVMYDNYDNITFIGTGMGKLVDDNFVVINVDQNKNISYDLICLNEEELDCLGELEDYIISVPTLLNPDNNCFELYPNPNSGIFQIYVGNLSCEAEISVYSYNGEIVFNSSYLIEKSVSINLEALEAGIYFVKVKHQDGITVKKMLVF
ncbi:MAG TPA: T9SS type A sorting domain-containing protein [Bacteroidales bacterium]|nr:T9SS type A sorting domain-containing protein [Bacteroidales bacterium]